MGQEITLALVPMNETERQQGYVAAFHSSEIEKAKAKLEHLALQIKKRTPVKFKEEQYLGYKVNYMEMKGFFKLFFGKFFRKFDKPHFVYLNDFVVFSNDTAVLHRCIESNISGDVLEKDETFKNFLNEFPSSPNFLAILNTRHFFPWMPEMVTEKTWYRMRKNRIWYESFPYFGFALESNKEYYATQFHILFQPAQTPDR